VKEGQEVKKGDLLLRIKPDNYIASTNSAHASHQAAIAGTQVAWANLEKAELECKRSRELFNANLISDSEFLSVRTVLGVARANYESSIQQSKQAQAALDRALDDLSKTIIFSPLSGTITKLKSQVGERVVGSITMTGTEIMTLANLAEMEARVDIGEVDIVLIDVGQKARLEVDAFKDRKFTGLVTDIANSARGAANNPQAASSQEATKFEVKIRIHEAGQFRPGMSVSAEVETRSQTNVIAVPIQSVTTRLPKSGSGKNRKGEENAESSAGPGAQERPGSGKPNERTRPVEVVFVAENGVAKMLPVKRGISDDSHVEIVEGLAEGQQVVSGGYKAINRELEDRKKIKIQSPGDGKGGKKPEAQP
jgi:HlyD family secretion protein